MFAKKYAGQPGTGLRSTVVNYPQLQNMKFKTPTAGASSYVASLGAKGPSSRARPAGKLLDPNQLRLTLEQIRKNSLKKKTKKKLSPDQMTAIGEKQKKKRERSIIRRTKKTRRNKKIIVGKRS